MNTEKIHLSAISANDDNPRFITDVKTQQLIASLLVFPKMLALRPIVVRGNGITLGGNMRFHALSCISEKSIEDITDTLQSQSKFKKLSKKEQSALVAYWTAWKSNPSVEILRADDLTDEEVREFIIKDNVAYGNWDWDTLANEWDTDELSEWGVDVPNFTPNDEMESKINADNYGDDFSLPDGDREAFQQMTFTLADDQAAEIKESLATIKDTDEFKYMETSGNENSNGNALYLIVKQWAEQKK